MADLSLIKFYYNTGVYSLNELYILVITNEITKEDFHEITGLNFDGIKQTRDWD